MIQLEKSSGPLEKPSVDSLVVPYLGQAYNKPVPFYARETWALTENTFK
jgi:hypothetical protein